MSYKSDIIKLHKLRYEFIKKLDSEDFSDKDSEKYDIQIDLLSNQILETIKQFFKELEVDFILEQLSNIGCCPNLLYDDNGHWAISSEGYQNVVIGDDPQDVNTHFFVKAENWKNSPREALYKFLHVNQDE